MHGLLSLILLTISTIKFHSGYSIVYKSSNSLKVLAHYNITLVS